MHEVNLLVGEADRQAFDASIKELTKAGVSRMMGIWCWATFFDCEGFRDNLLQLSPLSTMVSCWIPTCIKDLNHLAWKRVPSSRKKTQIYRLVPYPNERQLEWR